MIFFTADYSISPIEFSGMRSQHFFFGGDTKIPTPCLQIPLLGLASFQFSLYVFLHFFY